MPKIFNIEKKDINRQKWNLGWQYLAEKNEYESNKIERSFSSIVLDNVSILSTKLNLNSYLCEYLTLIKCSFFPALGKAGIKTIMKYLENKNINISKTELAVKYTEHDFTESGNTVKKEIYELLPSLFNDEINTDVLELNLVNICYRLIEKIKPIGFIDMNKFYDLEEQTFKRLTEICLSNNLPTWSTEFDLLNIPKINDTFSPNDEKFYLDSLEESINEDDFMHSILDFILVGYLEDGDEDE